MKQEVNDIKREILRMNIMIKSMYSGSNSKKTERKIKHLETELDNLLYKYYKKRIHLSENDNIYTSFYK